MRQRRPDRVLGGAADQFWAYCAQGLLCLPACQDCDRLSWPIQTQCPHCSGTRFSWRQLSGEGRLASWCTFDRRYYGDLLPVPWETILVELAEGVLFVSNPLGFTLAEARLDQPVRVAFLECEDGVGPFNLPVFRAAPADRG